MDTPSRANSPDTPAPSDEASPRVPLWKAEAGSPSTARSRLGTEEASLTDLACRVLHIPEGVMLTQVPQDKDTWRPPQRSAGTGASANACPGSGEPG